MHLFHVSPSPRIRELRPSMSRTKRKVAWLCHIGVLDWTIKHIAEHQNATTLYVYECDVPFADLTRHSNYAYLISRPVKVTRTYKVTTKGA